MVVQWKLKNIRVDQDRNLAGRSADVSAKKRKSTTCVEIREEFGTQINVFVDVPSKQSSHVLQVLYGLFLLKKLLHFMFIHSKKMEFVIIIKSIREVFHIQPLILLSSRHLV